MFRDEFVACLKSLCELTPSIEYQPVFSETEQAKRVYMIFGRKSLWSDNWVEVQSSELKNYNFFKITVRMR